MNRAVGYIRVSTEEQVREGISLDNQRAKIKAFATAKNWNLIHIYRDEGRSGKSLNRPGIQELLQDAQAGQFKVVIVYRVDRLTRKQRDLWYLLEDVFDKNSVGFVSVNEPFDTTAAIGKASLGVIGVFAQLERDLISERTKDALAHKKDQGCTLGRPVITDLDEKGLKIVTYIRSLRETGLSYARIARRLNLEAVPTSRGGKWFASTVSYVLKNIMPRVLGDLQEEAR